MAPDAVPSARTVTDPPSTVDSVVGQPLNLSAWIVTVALRVDQRNVATDPAGKPASSKGRSEPTKALAAFPRARRGVPSRVATAGASGITGLSGPITSTRSLATVDVRSVPGPVMVKVRKTGSNGTGRSPTFSIGSFHGVGPSSLPEGPFQRAGRIPTMWGPGAPVAWNQNVALPWS